MHHASINHGQRENTRSTVKIVGIYFLFGSLWILFFDQILARRWEETAVVTSGHTVRGWTFLTITTGMLYALILGSKAASRKVNNALLESEAKFRSVVESNIIGIIFWSSDGQVIDANDAFLRIVGYTRADLSSGKVSWLAMTPPEFQQADEHADDERRSSGSSAPYEKEYIRKDGSRVPVLIGIATLADSTGTHIGFVLEMSERKRVEHALLKSERETREILEKIQLVSVILDGNGALVFCNDFLLNLTGWRREEVIGTNWFETFVPDDQRGLIQFTFAEMSKKGLVPSHLEYEIATRSGERRVISWSNTVVGGEGDNSPGIIGIGEDVTERQRSEQRLLNSHERLRALSARLQFVREEERIRIAREIHDVLGQALTGLRMDVWWLLKRVSDATNALDRTRLLEKLESMSTLIDDTIPSVRKLATELRPGVLDDLGLVAAIEWQAREFQTRTGIECRCTIEVDGVDLGSDRSTAVFRIFQEILTNVARHAKAKKLEIRMNEFAECVVLVVNDNGRGITEREISGTRSLGLLGMRERALLFGGEVSIGRGPARGTVVTVKIPFQRRPEVEPVFVAFQAAGSP